MPNKSLNNNKKRFSVTLTQPYIAALDRLVKEGLYMDHQGGIRHALRGLFRFHGIEPLYNDLTKETEKVEKTEGN